jgi:hypothetical protein
MHDPTDHPGHDKPIENDGPRWPTIERPAAHVPAEQPPAIGRPWPEPWVLAGIS